MEKDTEVDPLVKFLMKKHTAAYRHSKEAILDVILVDNEEHFEETIFQYLYKLESQGSGVFTQRHMNKKGNVQYKCERNRRNRRKRRSAGSSQPGGNSCEAYVSFQMDEQGGRKACIIRKVLQHTGHDPSNPAERCLGQIDPALQEYIVPLIDQGKKGIDILKLASDRSKTHNHANLQDRRYFPTPADIMYIIDVRKAQTGINFLSKPDEKGRGQEIQTIKVFVRPTQGTSGDGEGTTPTHEIQAIEVVVSQAPETQGIVENTLPIAEKQGMIEYSEQLTDQQTVENTVQTPEKQVTIEDTDEILEGQCVVENVGQIQEKQIVAENTGPTTEKQVIVMNSGQILEMQHVVEDTGQKQLVEEGIGLLHQGQVIEKAIKPPSGEGNVIQIQERQSTETGTNEAQGPSSDGETVRKTQDIHSSREGDTQIQETQEEEDGDTHKGEEEVTEKEKEVNEENEDVKRSRGNKRKANETEEASDHHRVKKMKISDWEKIKTMEDLNSTECFAVVNNRLQVTVGNRASYQNAHEISGAEIARRVGAPEYLGKTALRQILRIGKSGPSEKALAALLNRLKPKYGRSATSVYSMYTTLSEGEVKQLASDTETTAATHINREVLRKILWEEAPGKEEVQKAAAFMTTKQLLQKLLTELKTHSEEFDLLTHGGSQVLCSVLKWAQGIFES